VRERIPRLCYETPRPLSTRARGDGLVKHGERELYCKQRTLN
jgi:hypothetical protein